MRIPFVIRRTFSSGCDLLPIAILALFSVSTAACHRESQGVSAPKPELDEAAKKVQKEGPVNQQTLAKYAYEHYYPREIQNYFRGMDMVARPKGVPIDSDAAAWPQQLLDKLPANPYALALEDFMKDLPPVELPSNPTAEQRAEFERKRQRDSEILGRNTWLIWCGGNERFWDWLATDLFGFIDLLKLVDSVGRTTRFSEAGLINEPDMVQATAPARNEFGLRLDLPANEKVRKWRADYVKEAFGNAIPRWQAAQDKRGGIKPERSGYSDGASEKKTRYGKEGGNSGYGTAANEEAYKHEVPPPAIYGLSSGVIGLRLFPNPKFIESKEAQERWDPDRYYNDPTYYNDPNLVRPYRVGMSCAYCHTSFHPLNPPRDISNPEWANLSGNIGAQYLRIRTAFGNLLKSDNFTYHALDSQPPGTIDTSLIPSDNINNTNTMNAIWGVPARVVRSFELPPEKLSPSSASQPSVWGNPDGKTQGTGYNYVREAWAKDIVPETWKRKFEAFGLTDKIAASNGNPRWVPRVLLDGADSVGAWVALARVYLNIGTYSEQWNRLHNPVLGYKKQRPFRIEDCEENSVYWNATQLRVAALRDYFLKITPPMPLLAAADLSGRQQKNEADTKSAQSPFPAASVPEPVSGEAANPAAAPPPKMQAVHWRIEPIDEAGLQSHAKGLGNADFQTLLAKERAMRIDTTKLDRGRRVFAQNCIVCHSSVQPESHLADFPPTLTPEEKKVREESRAKLIVGEGRAAGYVKDYANLAELRRAKFDEWAEKGEFWDHDPGQWLDPNVNPDYAKWAQEVVQSPEFWTYNYLSTDFRIPINLVRTNSARAMATNAMEGNLWQDFSSESFRKMPSVGAIDFYNPYPWKDGGKQRRRVFGKKDLYPYIERGDGQFAFTPRHKVAEGVPEGGGGPGFYRVPTLISIWATAPLLHNNSLGLFNNDPSVDGRLLAFDDAIRKLLWPEKRLESSSYNGATAARLKADHGLIWRLPHSAPLHVPAKYAAALGLRLPLGMALHAHIAAWFPWLEASAVREAPWLPSLVLLVIAFGLLLLARRRLVRWLGYFALVLALFFGFVLYVGTGKLGDVRVGPFPKGTPVDLILNINPDEDPTKVKKTVNFVISKLAEIESKHLTEEAAQKVLREEIAPAMMEISKCPDFVMDQGHYYPWFDSMTDDDKNALIELLKTF